MKLPPPIDGRFISLGSYRFDKSGQWYVLVSNEGTTGHVSVDAVQFLPEDEDRGDKKEEKKAESKDAPVESKQLEAELKKLTESAPPKPVAMAVLEGPKIADTYVCIRGSVHNKGETVPRGFLQVATSGKMPTFSARESGRRELAEWLASKVNPLTARVMANRVWHHLFGAGLVRTVDEFGKTGELPSHPELLDHLALTFMEDGWSVKKLVRRLVLSRAYQMSSAADRDALAADPENRLL
jgi:hypothetical protein